MSMTRFVVSFNVDVLAVVHSGLIAVRPFGLFDDVTDPNLYHQSTGCIRFITGAWTTRTSVATFTVGMLLHTFKFGT